jgi:hypothetical protein
VQIPLNLRERGKRVHAIRVLEEDHARVEALLSELSGADEATRTTLSKRLAGELVVHTIAEDNVFLPQVEEAIEEDERMSEEYFDEDTLAEATSLIAEVYEHNGWIRDLLQRPWPATAGEHIDGLRKAVEFHVRQEEALFPKAREVLEEEDFERIGDLIEHCKWQVRGLAQAKLASSSSFQPAPVETLLE